MIDVEVDCLRREVTDLRRTVDRLDAVLMDLQHLVRGLTKDAMRNGSQNVRTFPKLVHTQPPEDEDDGA